MINIIYLRKDQVAAHRSAVEAVAAERIYLGLVTLPSFDPEQAFPLRLIENDWPMYAAMDGNDLVGWADITPVGVPECVHRGVLGMGIVASHRGAGTGRRLLDACLEHAPRCGITKVEVTVFTSSTAAIALYRRAGFTDTGVIKDYRRLEGVSYDALMMEKFLA